MPSPTKNQLRPFEPNVDVLKRIRPMCDTDVRRVAELHHRAMGKSLCYYLATVLRNLPRNAMHPYISRFCV